MSAVLLSGCKKTANTFSGANPLGLSSDDRARQAKLQPVIECINQTLSHFQNLAPRYERKYVSLTQQRNLSPIGAYIDFTVTPSEQNGQFSRECAAGLKKAAALPPALPEIDGPARDAAPALVAMIQPGADVEAYLAQKAYLNDQGYVRLQQLNAAVQPLLTRVVKDADALQAGVEQQESVLRQHQLDAMEKRYGRNLAWHTLNSMRAARVMNDRLLQLARAGQLTPDSVAQAEQPLQTAYDGGAAWVRAHPDAGTPDSNGATPVWFHIAETLSHELGNVNELRQYLGERNPDPSTVRSDLFEVNSTFDQLVQSYNQEQRFAR